MRMVDMIEIAHGASWNTRRTSWMKKGEEVDLYLSKISEMIFML